MSPSTATASMPPPVVSDRRITAAEFEQMDFEFPVELVHGKVEHMPPAEPRLGRVCLNVGYLIEQWLRTTNLGTVVGNDSSVVIDELQSTVRGPDVAYVTWQQLQQRTIPKGSLRVAPNLVVEVLSPTDRWDRIEVKLNEYFTVGVQEVWVVSIDERVVWVCQPQSRRRLTETEELTTPTVLPGFTARVADFFLHV